MSTVNNSTHSKVSKPTAKAVQPKAKSVQPSVEVKGRSTAQEEVAKKALRSASETPSPSEIVKKKKKKVWLIPLIIVIVLALVAGIVAFMYISKKEKERLEYEKSLIVHPQQTSGYTIDGYLACLNSWNILGLSDGSVVTECYIDDELLMVNNNEKVEEYIRWVCSTVSTKDADFTTKLVNASHSVDCTFSIVDYATIASSLDVDKIADLLVEYELEASDVDFSLRIQDVFCDYMFTLEDIPYIEVEIPLVLTRVDVPVAESPYYFVVSNDKELDTALFCSDAFHYLLDEFGKVAVGWTGFKTESYIDQEEQENPAYVEWLAMLNAEIAKYPTWKNTSKCLYEPYYLRDENNKIVKDENGNKVVNFYVLFEGDSKGKKIKDKSSPYGYKYIPEPEHTVWVDVERERQVEDPWVDGSVFPYSWVGYWYVLENNLPVRYGNGTMEYPLGVNTWYPTKLTLCDGTLVDVRIELVQSYIGADAVQKALSLSEKNRGLDSSSVVQLVICEFLITNTTDGTLTFSSDMVLVDQYGNKLSRTGTIYGMNDIVTVGAGESVVVTDWCTSTDLKRYQVAWGRSFDVDTSAIFFDVVK